MFTLGKRRIQISLTQFKLQLRKKALMMKWRCQIFLFNSKGLERPLKLIICKVKKAYLACITRHKFLKGNLRRKKFGFRMKK